MSAPTSTTFHLPGDGTWNTYEASAEGVRQVVTLECGHRKTVPAPVTRALCTECPQRRIGRPPVRRVK